jgi:valyl-tRNA synthetase
VISGGLEGIRRLAGVGEWRFVGDAGAVQGPVGKLPLDRAELLVPLAGLIDLDEERERLERALAQATSELDRAERKLANDGFLAKAPAAGGAAERDKAGRWREAKAALEAQLAELQ